MMLVLRYKQRDQNIHVEEIRQAVLSLATPLKPINVVDREYRRTGSRVENRDAAVEAHVGFCDSPKESFHELIDFLSGLAGQTFEAVLQGGVQVEGDGWHERTSSQFMVARNLRGRDGTLRLSAG